ncbi:TlpA family protein disulfide reductase [Membranihabitans marinus]|uniref:TlpA family protein disulfide reductase n=1 Tax=Membranihabitans marinus TaxID=1227546 RepID=UPI001F3C5C5A|nr:TlpA disulfide reductase family protein [Membranihabitans marinus]
MSYFKNVVLLLFVFLNGYAKTNAETNAETNQPAIQLSEWIQSSQMTQLADHQFILIEFWATYCGPCHQIKDHIEYLQREDRENLFVLSLTNESPFVVEQFLQGRSMQTAVALDDEGRTFERYKVTSMPYAVLLSPGGHLIWKGHPSALNPQILGGIMADNNEVALPLSKKLALRPVVKEELEAEFIQYGEFRFRELPYPCPYSKQIRGSDFHITGSLQHILSDILPIENHQIRSDQEAKYLELYCDTSQLYSSIQQITESLLEKYHLTLASEQNQVKQLEMHIVDSQQLWQTNVIDWGVDSPGFLIDDRNIKADNQTLSQLAQKLGSVIGAQINVLYDDGSLHDWDIHIKHYSLMEEQLASEYGIEIRDVGWTQEHVLLLRSME